MKKIQEVIARLPGTVRAGSRFQKKISAALGAYVIVGIFFVVLAGKIFGQHQFGFLYLYGILVSLVLCTQFFVALRLYRDPYKVAKKILRRRRIRGDKIEMPTVSIMVAVKDEEGIIDRCVKSLKAQTYPHTEIIVVNDGSEDGTAEILDMHADGGGVEVIHLEKNIGKKRALAQGMLRAQGTVFAFTDSDSILAPDAIEKIVDIFVAFPDVGSVSGHCRPSNSETNVITKVQDTWYEGQFSVRKAFESYFGAVTCVSGPLAVFRREAVFNYIPAWENDSFLGQEFRFATDRTMTGFLLGSATIGESLKSRYADSPFIRNEDYPCRDWKIVYCKSARAWTHVPDTFRRVLKQQVRWKKSFIRNMFFTGLFYWRKNPVAAAVYYLHILFVLVGPVIAFRHLVYFPLRGNPVSAFLFLSGILLVGLTFGLAYRREGDKSARWMYRPLMSLASVFLLSWLIFYSALTIRKSIWSRS